ncbi:hypothetical protein IB275_30555 [Pseudomonas sp. PDM21]|uniref:hypothetical protein n=1 Tax=Pseudomonas sp. PDM21 TaxID=2769257 RepID=UPI00177CE041|nr:hypothetical protein [Pseudomonas sp. PDM21]MBD9674958.1 hypothetical protein [Pseudomonas sp. PDM21]
MSYLVLTTVTTFPHTPGTYIVFPYPYAMKQSDFVAAQPVTLVANDRDFPGLAATAEADGMHVPWPVTSPYPLPADEYNVEFATTAAPEFPDDVTQLPYQAPSSAADVATLQADFNALLTKLRNSGQMKKAP